MKKISLAAFALLLLSIASCRFAAEKTAPQVLKVLDEKTMTTRQAQDWDSLAIDWHAHAVHSIMDKYKLNHDCLGCADVWFDMETDVDADGNMVSFTVTHNGIFCMDQNEADNKKISKEMIDSFKKQKVPSSLRGAKVKMRVGHPSKC